MQLQQRIDKECGYTSKVEKELERRERKSEAKQRLDNGARLVKQRDRGKRKSDDMSATEQQVIEDFEVGKSRKQYEQECAKRPLYFQSKML